MALFYHRTQGPRDRRGKIFIMKSTGAWTGDDEKRLGLYQRPSTEYRGIKELNLRPGMLKAIVA